MSWRGVSSIGWWAEGVGDRLVVGADVARVGVDGLPARRGSARGAPWTDELVGDLSRDCSRLNAGAPKWRNCEELVHIGAVEIYLPMRSSELFELNRVRRKFGLVAVVGWL